MKIAFNPSTVAALTTPPNNKDITFDLRGRNIFARGVKFYGTDTNTWRDIKINNVSIGSHTLDLRNGSNTTLTNTNGVVTINSTWRPVVDNLTSDSTTSSLSAKQGKVLKALIDGKSNSDHNHDGRYLKLTGGTMASNALITFADSGSWGTSKKPQGARGGLYWTGQSDYAKLYAEETVENNLDLVIQFGDDNSNGLSIRDKANTQTSYISSSGVITTRTFKGNLDWSYITNKPATATRWPSWAEVTGKPSSFTPSTHTHGLSNSVFFLKMPSINGNAKWKEVFGYPVNYHLLSSVRISNPAPEWCVGYYGSGILYGGYDTKGFMSSAFNEPFIMWAGGNGSSDDSVPKWYIGIKGTHKSIYNLATIASEANAAYNLRHSHANKSVLDGITSALVNSWNTAYNFVSNITGTDTDKVINKWEEIVNFLAGITEDNKLNTLLNSKLSVYELADNTNVGTIKNNGIYYSTTDASSGTLINSPFNTGFAFINMTSYDGGDDLRRSRLAFNTFGEIKVSDDRDQANTAETWYNVLTSKNSGINGSTIKLNGTSITVYSSGTADGRYVKKSGDTMSGVLTIDTTNFGALTIKRNDDANGASIQFRGKSSVYGYIGLNNSTKDKQFLRWSSDTSRIYTILDTSSTYISNGKGVINGTTITQVDNATNSTNSTNARKLVNWYSARPTSLNAQFGDGSLRIFYATSSTTEGKPAEDSHILHLAWDNTGGYDAQLAVHVRSGKVSTRAQNGGTWQPWKTLAFTTDIPSSLKNPYSFNVFGVVYDGSAAKTVTTSNFISQVNEGGSTITDGTMLITSYASNSGFADTNAVNVPYKRKAFHLWEYIKAKTDSLYATKGHNHDGRYVRAFGTSNDNIDSDWGQSFKTFDPIPLGTPPEKNPNISLLSIGENFNRRKQLAFIWNNDNIYYRRHTDSGFTNWRRLAFANEIPTSLKSPNSLSWSGYNTGSYDGSSPKSFVIPSNTNQLTNGAGFITSSDSISGNAATATKVNHSLLVFGKSFNGSADVTVADTDLIASILTGTAKVTDKTEFLTSYASDNGFNDSNAKNKIIRRPAYAIWGYINSKTISNADKLDNVHLNGIFTALSNTNNGVSMTIGTVTKSLANMQVYSATKLQTPRTIWGQSFDGTGNVSGFMKNVKGLIHGDSLDEDWSDGNNTHPWYGIDYRHCVDSTETGKAYTSISSYYGLYFKTGDQRFIFDGGNVGIGTTSPTQKLDVYGNIRAAGQIIREGHGGLWVQGRDAALLRETSAAGYHTLWSLKTTDGSWDFGEYNAGSDWNNIPVLSYITDSNYNSGNNAATYQIKFPLASGTVALTSNIPNPTNYYWANVKISASSSTTTSPTVHTLAATRVCAGHNPGIDNSISCSNWFRSSGNTGWYNTTYQGGWYMSDTSWIRAHNGVGIYTSGQIYSSSSIRMSNILLEHTDEINNSANGSIYLNYRNSGNVNLCYGGGNVGIGTNTPAYKLDVKGDIYSSGYVRASSGFIKGSSSDSYVLLGGGGHKLESSLNVTYSQYLKGITLTGGDSNNEGYRLIFEKTMGGWNINYGVWAIAFRHSGRGTLNIGFDTTNSDGSTYIYNIRFLGSTVSRESTPFRAFYNSTTKVFRIYWHYWDYTSGDIAVLRGNMEPHNGTWMASLPNDVGTELAITYNMADQAANADTVDGYHATDGRTFNGDIHWGSWNNTWSDGTHTHPWYGFDHRYPNTGAYSTTISDYFGMTIKTYNTLLLDCGTLSLNSRNNVGIGTNTPAYKLDVNGQMGASGFHHSSVNSDNYILLAGGGYKSFGGNISTPIFLGYLNLYGGGDGTVSSSFPCLGYSVSFTYTRGGNFCKIVIPDTTRLSFYIVAATASVNYSGRGMDTWTGNHRGSGAWWLHCYAYGWNEVRVKGFCQANNNNDSWWGGNPLWNNEYGANRITVCIFGHVTFK